MAHAFADATQNCGENINGRTIYGRRIFPLITNIHVIDHSALKLQQNVKVRHVDYTLSIINILLYRYPTIGKIENVRLH